jgi:dimethylargininase
MFKRAIVRKPCQQMVNGITTAHLGKPDYALALEQHELYVEALKKCGLEVIVLELDTNFPDSCFVEDTAIVNEKIAIIDRPGAKSRQGEQIAIKETLSQFYPSIEDINAPGTLEGGDVMRIENTYYVGLSDRTNMAGFTQFNQILTLHGFKCILIPMKEMLHLKTGVNYLGENTLLVAGEFIHNTEFSSFQKIIVPQNESYAANCVRINDFIIMPRGYPTMKQNLEKLSVKLIELNMSEFRKLDGGLSCLSIRF